MTNQQVRRLTTREIREGNYEIHQGDNMLEIRVDFEDGDVTLGELRAFVAILAGLPDDEPLGLASDGASYTALCKHVGPDAVAQLAGSPRPSKS